jgi:hypothetical protein
MFGGKQRGGKRSGNSPGRSSKSRTPVKPPNTRKSNKTGKKKSRPAQKEEEKAYMEALVGMRSFKEYCRVILSAIPSLKGQEWDS